jgi:hypothetical protein
MGRKITVELSEESWLFLMEKQFQAKKKGEKVSLSKMVSEIVDKEIQLKEDEKGEE